MKKITLTLLLITGLSNYNFGQVSSNPGTWDWSNPLAWSGASVPTSTQVVNIGTNSSITVDFPLTHDATINLIGGTLQSVLPANTLTINGGDLNLANFSSIVNFLGSGTPTQITINDGHLNNGGVFMSGGLTIDFNLTSGNSVNNGDFMVQGDFTITGNETFDNNLAMNVSGQLLVDANCTWNNNQNASLGTLVNNGDIVNTFNFSTTDSLYNAASGTIVSSLATISAGTNAFNYGSYTSSDSLSVGNDFMNYGTFTNNQGGVSVVNELYNSASGSIVSAMATVATGADFTNYGSYTSDDSLSIGYDFVNYGTFTNNQGGISIVNELYNSATGSIVSALATVATGTDVTNYGSYTISDSLSIGNDFVNYGTFINNEGRVAIANDFYNYLSISGTGTVSGKFDIANYSLNDITGSLTGDLDICDATLAPGDHLDDDLGYANNDFNTVVFCTVSYASIDENEKLIVSVFPNPTNDVLNIRSDVSFSAELVDLNGAVIYKLNAESTAHTLNLSDLENGVYFLKTYSNDASAVQQVVKL